ncbi:phage Gp37/Gp68 family protein [Tritonibacter mobilis]|uniref:phage Gp37/Gp68 family protein n=1 Tax=Tritonibacter mobilis TaxID=379347 RepID=UPI000806E21F|nr:phage Gp37/Gp68 family protein [Tritonibacter mobilis]
MTDLTKIEWTDFTVNFWEGCQKVGPGCDHCYAEARDTRFTGGKHWGPGAPRRKVKGGIAKLRKINRDAEAFHAAHGRWPRVFCSSLSDVFDKAVDPEWRREACAEIEAADNTRIQMLTKRIGNVLKMVPATWLQDGWPSHVGLMITVVNQEEANRDVPKLLDLKTRFGIPWVGLSMEPLLGPVDISPYMLGCYECGQECGFRSGPENPPEQEKCNSCGLITSHFGEFCSECGHQDFSHVCPDCEAVAHEYHPDTETIDWVICGGESGPGARPMHPNWARSLRDQCNAAGVPFLFKQWGEWHPDALLYTDTEGNCPPTNMKVGKKKSGRLLDGREWNGVPA